MRDRRLKCIETNVERQERMPPEGNDGSLFLNRQNRGFWIGWPGLRIRDSRALAPFGDRLQVDAMALGKATKLS